MRLSGVGQPSFSNVPPIPHLTDDYHHHHHDGGDDDEDVDDDNNGDDDDDDDDEMANRRFQTCLGFLSQRHNSAFNAKECSAALNALQCSQMK